MTAPLLRGFFTFADLAAWVAALGWDLPILNGNGRLADAPERCLFLGFYGGPGMLLEDMLDVVAVQARVRGAQQDPNDSQTLTMTLDGLILTAPVPTTVGATSVRRIRAANRPAPDRRDAAGRTHWTANYYFDIPFGL